MRTVLHVSLPQTLFGVVRLVHELGNPHRRVVVVVVVVETRLGGFPLSVLCVFRWCCDLAWWTFHGIGVGVAVGSLVCVFMCVFLLLLCILSAVAVVRRLSWVPTLELVFRFYLCLLQRCCHWLFCRLLPVFTCRLLHCFEERERERERETERDRERQRETETETERQRETERETETDRQTDRDRDRERLTD